MTISHSSPSTETPLSRNARAETCPIDRRAILNALIVFLFVLAMNFPLPPHSPLAGTESHRGLTAHGMVQSGEWLVPRLLGRVYLAKPPLHYWLQATAESIAGTTAEFIWRVPSAVCSATLAALLGLFAHRWFGGRAGILTGFSYASMVALWATSRSADIDITDVLASNAAAMCVLEIYFVSPKRIAGWVLAAAFCFAATFMAKGPGGLPILLGSMICVGVFSIRERRAVHVLLPRFWLPIVLGIFAFAGYGYAVYRFLVSHHMTLDWSGLQEGAMDLHPHDWSLKRAIEWILLAPTLFAYTLPVSLALPLTFVREIRGGEVRSGRMFALVGTVLFSWTVCFISGMHLPRYAYVTLPLMSPLAGAILDRVDAYSVKWQELLRWILRGSVVVFAIATVAMLGVLWRHHEIRPILIAAAVISICAATMLLPRISRSASEWSALWPAPIMLLALAVLGTCNTHYDRVRRSGREWGQKIRLITGPDAELMGGALILDQPEVFYYSGLKPHPYDGDTVDWRNVHQSGWIVLEDMELSAWRKDVPARLSQLHPMVVNRNPATLLWYDVTMPSMTGATEPDGSGHQP